MKTEASELKKLQLQKNALIMATLMHLAVALGGFSFALAGLFGGWSPFGAAYVGGTPKKYLAASVAGSTAGYLIRLSSGGFTYIAALFAAVTVKLVLGEQRLTRSPLFAAALSFFCLGVTGLAVTYSYGTALWDTLGQAALGSAVAYFVRVVFSMSAVLKQGTDIRECTAVIFFASVILLALCRVGFLGLSLGRILAVSLILASARYGMAAYGGVCGCIVGFVMVISNREYFAYSSIFAFSGLLSGLFTSLGSAGMVAAYIITTLISALLTQNTEVVLPLLFEALIGGGIFLLLPRRLTGLIGGLLSPTAEVSRLDSVKGQLIMRLSYAGGALRDVYQTVEEVAQSLSKVNSPSVDKALSNVEEEACTGCSLRRHCWETAKELTVADLLAPYVRGTADRQGRGFNCLRQKSLDATVEKHLQELKAMQSAEARLREVRGIINDQFDGVSSMLFDLAEEFRYDVRHDAKAAENVILAFKNMGFHTVECVAVRDKPDRLSVDIHLKGVADRVINKMEVVKNVSLALGRRMDTPTVSVEGDDAFVYLTQRPKFKVEVGLTQIPAERGKLCGDSAKYFADGRGRLILLISDGMGTGGRAAVDSAMVSGLFSRMLRSGFGYGCSLKIINSSMLFRSTEEALATVDIAAIDLFTGELELLKAGAAPTLVRQGGRLAKAESTALPPGILRDVSFDRAALTLKAEDLVVMISDGAAAEGTDYISELMHRHTIASAQSLADEIAFAARRRRGDGRSDDITVLTAKIFKP